MRKPIIAGLVVFFIVATGAAFATWYAQISQAKRGIELAAEELQKQGITLTYSALESSGFPSEAVITIVNPRLTGRIDQAIKAKHPDATAMPEWSEDFALNGSVSFGINATSNRAYMIVNGTFTDTSTIGGKTLAIASQGSGSSMCTLEMQRAGGIFSAAWNFDKLFNSGKAGEEMLEEFRLLDCSFSPYSIIDQQSKESLISSGGGRIYASNTPQGASRQVRILLKSTDSEVTAAGDKIFDHYFKSLAPEQPFSTAFSMYGKQNMDIDISYSGPRNWQTRDASVPIDIRVGSFKISSAVYTIDSSFHLTSATANDNMNARLVFKNTATFSEQYDVLIRQILKDGIFDLYNNPEKPRPPQLEGFMAQYTPEQMIDIIAPALPNFYSLGKLVQAVDVSYQGKPNFSEGSATLSELELSAATYGITGKGSLSKTVQQMIPTTNLALSCANCLRMVDDAASYANRLQRTLAVFDPAQASNLAVPQQRVDNFKLFLIAIAEPSADTTNTTLNYTIVSDGTSNITVSGKQMGEIMGLYQQYLAPAPQDAAP